MHKKHLPNFDTIAFAYDTLVSWVFGSSIKRAQFDTLSWIPEGATVLIIGGGTGWYLKELLVQKKPRKVVYLEASQQMLNLTSKKIKSILPRIPDTIVELRLGAEENIYPGEHFDIIVTHFFLDVFDQVRLKKIVHTLNSVLAWEGLWLIADFRLPEPKAGIDYLWKIMLVKIMLLFFRVVSHITAQKLPEFPELFNKIKMHSVYDNFFYRGLIFSSVYVRKK